MTHKPLCFPYATKAYPSQQVCGCDGTMRDSRRQATVACNRAHMDLADPSWAKADKKMLSAAWHFIQHKDVKPHLVPTSEFVNFMA